MEKLLFCYLIMYVFIFTLLIIDNYSFRGLKLLKACDIPEFLIIIFYIISLITPTLIIRIDNNLMDLFLFKAPFNIIYIIILIYSLILIFFGYMKLGAAYCYPRGRARAAETIFIHFNLLVTSSTLLTVCYYDLIQSKTTILIYLLMLLEILNIVIGILKNNELFYNVFNPLGIFKYILLVLFFKSKSIKGIPIIFNNSYIIFFILLLISILFMLNNKSKINEYTQKKKYYNFFALKTYKDMLENSSVSYNINDILNEDYPYFTIYQDEKDSDDYKCFYLPYERKDNLLNPKYDISYKLKDIAIEYSNKIYPIMNKNLLNVEITIFLLILFLLSV